MNRAVLFIILIAALIVVLLGAAWYFTTNGGPEALPPEPPLLEDALPDTGSERSIIAQHQFVDGTHTVAGEVDLPTPCHLLETEVVVRESFPEQVAIQFTTAVDDETLCAQVITPQRFKVSFEASENALITATLDGEPVVLNLIKVSEDKSLDDFEVFIKG